MIKQSSDQPSDQPSDRPSDQHALPFFGESLCQATYKTGKKKGQQCTNKAYYYDIPAEQIRCGMHSEDRTREDLMKNPRAKEIAIEKCEELKELAEDAAMLNRKYGNRGVIICDKLLMMKSPTCQPGFTMIFPNFRHADRLDGIGCATLSPKSIGPIQHWMRELPPARNLENFHQFSKVYPWEADEFTLDKNGNIISVPLTSAFNKVRIQAYQDPEPQRHKHKYSPLLQLFRENHPEISNELPADPKGGLPDPEAKTPMMKEIAKISSGLYKPLYTLYTFDGRPRRFTYMESRYVYCHLYELAVRNLPEFKKLVSMLDRGYNLQIVGYDGLAVDRSGKTLAELYLDESQPFGHELVLYTMLRNSDAYNYPWNIFRRQHLELYEGMTI